VIGISTLFYFGLAGRVCDCPVWTVVWTRVANVRAKVDMKDILIGTKVGWSRNNG